MKFIPQSLRSPAKLFRSPLSQRIIAGMFVSLVAIEAILLVPSVNRRRGELLN